MLLTDVNVLIYAHRKDTPDHPRYAAWLTDMVASAQSYATADLVLSGFLRVVTNPKVFRRPSTLEEALSFVREFREASNCVVVRPGERHWEIFVSLCRKVGARGNLIPDAYLAALAIETGSEWVTTDRDYSRFQGLRWRHPLDTS